jgi:hypothetical protein
MKSCHVLEIGQGWINYGNQRRKERGYDITDGLAEASSEMQAMFLINTQMFQ